jgi:hypothetical protein
MKGEAAMRSITPVTEPPAFVVQTFASAGALLVDCLQTEVRPRWKTLKASGPLLSRRVYRKVAQLNAQPGIDWSVQFYSMIGLETTRVVTGSSEFRWNQLHIRGFYPQIGITPAAMTQHMQELDPERRVSETSLLAWTPFAQNPGTMWRRRSSL